MRTIHRGFTLVELMVVIAILGVLATLATSTTTERASVLDTSEVVAGALRQCGRAAIAGGPVRDDVAVLNGAGRALVRIVPNDDDYTMTVGVIREDDLPANTATLVVSTTVTIKSPIRIAGTSDQADLTAIGAPEEALPSGGIDLFCFPNGSSQAATIYLEDHRGRQARVAVLPMSGEPAVLTGW